MERGDGRRQVGGAPGSHQTSISAKPGQRFTWSYLLVFLAGAGIIAALTVRQIDREYQDARRYWDARLSTQADDRVLLVTRYLDRRREDAEFLAELPTLRTWLSPVAERAQGAVPPTQHSFIDFLAAFTAVHRYPGAYILDPGGSILARSPGARELDADDLAICRRAASSGKPQVENPEHAATVTHPLTFAAPILAEDSAGNRTLVVGVAAIVDDPSATLFPLLVAVAVPTGTGETVLSLREGNAIYYFSPLRHAPGGTSGTYQPLRPDLASRAAEEGRETVGDFLDYRGVRVVAATRKISVTGWGLVSKIDRDEALAPFYHEARLEGISALLLIVVLGGIVMGHRRRQGARLLEEMVAHQHDVLSERHYAQEIVDSVPAWLLVLSADLQILSANQSFLAHFQLRREEVEGRPLGEILRTEALPDRMSEAVHGTVTSQDVMLDVTVGGREEKQPARITLADLVRIAEGEAHVLLVVEDLTESESLRAVAEGSGQRLRDLVESLDAIVWEADPVTWQFSFVSRRAEEILGYPVEQWVKEPDFWVNHMHPDDRGWATALCRESSAQAMDHHFEYRAIAADGRVVWLRDEVRVATDKEGVARQLRGLMVDVTERKQHEQAIRESEDRYRDLVEHSQDLLGAHDAAGRVLSANLAATRAAGCSRPEDLVGKSIVDFLAPDVRSEFHNYLRAVLATGHARGLMKVVTAQGEERIIEYDNTLRTEGLEKPVVRCMGHDVTERFLAQAALRASEERLRAHYKRLPIPTFSWRRAGDDFVLAEYNDAAASFTRGEIERRVGSRATEVYHDHPEIVADLSRCFLEKRSIRRSVRYPLLSTGDAKPVDVTYCFIPPDLVMVCAQEMGEARRAAEPADVAAAAPSTPQALGVVYLCRNDARYTMLYVADSIEQLSGYTREEFAQDRISLVDLYHPADAARIQDEVRRAIAERRPFHSSYRIRHKSGEWRLVEAVAIAMREGDEVVYWQGILTGGAGEALATADLERAGAATPPRAAPPKRSRGTLR